MFRNKCREWGSTAMTSFYYNFLFVKERKHSGHWFKRLKKENILGEVFVESCLFSQGKTFSLNFGRRPKVWRTDFDIFQEELVARLEELGY